MPDIYRKIQLDGSYAEGGGALLCSALSMSSLTLQGVHLFNIRAKERKPGLNAEDRALIQAFKEISAADIEGFELGADEIIFTPTQSPQSVNLNINMYEYGKGPMGGNSLKLLHALWMVLARSGAYSSLVIEGETFSPKGLNYDYFEWATCTLHRKQGIYAFPHLEIGGFGRASKGEVWLEIEPSAAQALEWATRGELLNLKAIFTIAEINETIVRSACKDLKNLFLNLNLELKIETIPIRSRDKGMSVTLIAEFERGLGAISCCTNRQISIEEMIVHAFEEFMLWFNSEATLSPFLACQSLISAAFAEGNTCFTINKVTQELQTIAWVIKQFMPIKITITGKLGESATVSIRK